MEHKKPETPEMTGFCRTHLRITIIYVQISSKILKNLTINDIMYMLHDYTYNGVSIVICHKVYANQVKAYTLMIITL